MITNAQDIKSSADIYHVVSQHVNLKRQGVNYIGCCPFHDEKTPSFIVSPSKNIFKCFGCGEGGDATSFVMNKLGITYPEALEYIAEQSGLSVTYDESKNRKEYLQQQKEDKRKLDYALDTLAQAYKTYFTQHEGEQDISIYGDRAYTPATLNAFKVALPTLTDKLASTTIDKDILHAAGWLSNGQHGYYDFFKGRVLFPIMDKQGNIRAITARATETPMPIGSARDQKYINSRTSDIYEKRDHLYGLYQAMQYIRKEGRVYIMEGATDVVTAYEYGVRNAVATLGTALSAEQAQLLKRCMSDVVLCWDHDALVKPEVVQAIDKLIAMQIPTHILLLPEGEDPDSFLRSQSERSTKGWDMMVEDRIQDAINWKASNFSLSNNHQVDEAIVSIAQTISHVDSDTKRTLYCKQVSKTLGVTVTVMKEAVKEARSDLLSNKQKLTPSQEDSIRKYGIFSSYNKYFKSVNNLNIEISNFTIDPIMLVISREYSQRLVSVTNEHKQTTILDIDSDDFVSLMPFKKKVAAKGNYLFSGKEDDYIKVQKQVYDRTPNCYAISTMGYHKQGFWTWGNGITTPEGDFIPVNKYGVVKYEGEHYYISAFSQIHVDIKSDDDGNFEDPGKYHYFNKKSKATFVEWSKLFYQVFGDNAIISIGYYISTVFMDIIFDQFNVFPHLNLFGPQGSGKSFMAQNMIPLFGKPRPPVNLNSDTLVAITRRNAQLRNGFNWGDEYSPSIDPKTVELLKNFYDGVGRNKGKKTNDHSTSRTPVNGATIISGQVMPNQDPALLQRCITLFFKPMKANKEQARIAKDLKDWGKDASLSAVTAQIFKLRPLFKKEFYSKFVEVKTHMEELPYDVYPDTRVINNFAIIATSVELVRMHHAVPFTLTQMFDFILDRINSQTSAVAGASEVYNFWSIIALLIERDKEFVDQYAVETQLSVKIADKHDQTSNYEFGEPTKVLYLSFNVAYLLYRKEAKSSGVDRVLDKKSLIYYLENAGGESYIGRCKAKHMGGKSKRCLMFHADKLPIDLALTSFDKPDIGVNISKPDDGMKPSEFPFD